MNLSHICNGGQQITDVMLLNQYYYDVKVQSLSAWVIARSSIYAVDHGVDVNDLKIFVRRDEIESHDDFGDLNVIRLTKGLQPKHYQIAVPGRKPKILKGVRVPV